MDKLSLVRDFWDETPCDGQPTFALRSRLRYGKEPWLLPLLDRIAANHQCILEVGCGQGTDGISLCQRMRPGGRYVGVDMSEVSLASARSAAEEAGGTLRVSPVFEPGNAEHLQFADNSFPCVLSVGAVHHSEDTARAIAEIRRVLAPGGTGLILLYRTLAPKVFTAHALRGVQRGLDAVLRTDRVLYRALRSARIGEGAGTAIYECFGVPILRSYTRSGMQRLFRGFSSLQLHSYGYLWLAEVAK